MSLPRIATRAFGAPLLYAPGKAVAFLLGLGGRLVDGGIEITNPVPAINHVAFENGRPSMGVVGDQLGRLFDAKGVLPFQMVGNVAVIPVEGTLVHKGAWVGSDSGETSYEGIQTQVQRALRSERVAGAVLEVDSFGGEVAGAFQTARMIAQLSAAKPTIAILTNHALSAGFLMASAARQIVIPEDGRAGSIGVIRMFVDARERLAKDGLKVTLIHSGEHKVDGHPFVGASPELFEQAQAEVHAMRAAFAEQVGQFRGGRMPAAKALETEAQDFGPEDSVRLGLADAVGDGHEAFAEFVNLVNRKG